MALTQSEFNQLVVEHGPTLYRLAYRLVGDRIEAEDIVQDTYRSLWKGRERFDAEKSVRAFLATILRRRVADSFRRRTLRLVVGNDLSLDEPTQEDSLDQGYSDEMQRALAKLPAELRETLIMVVVGELTHQEAAEALGVPLGTVLSRVSRARTRLREYLTPSPAKSLENA